MNILGGMENNEQMGNGLVWFGAKRRSLNPRVQLKLPAEVAIRVWVHIFGQIFANAAPIPIGDPEPLQLRGRLSDALGCSR